MTLHNFLDERLAQKLQKTRPTLQRGRVIQALGTTIRATGINARIGQQCRLIDPTTNQTIAAEVVGLVNDEVILVPLSGLQGVATACLVEVLADESSLYFDNALLGRVIDAFGMPLDSKPMPPMHTKAPLYLSAPSPLSRKVIDTQFITGIRSVDTLLSAGVGQRIGVFAMAGGGKSTLLGMLARQAQADVIVIGLIGERGREVREFVEETLGPEGLQRSVLIVSTSDRPAMERLRAAYAATAIAEGFRSQGARVLLLMDSVTRVARALREIGLSVGEPAVRRGYPPSVFAELPRLFERSGNDAVGSITAFYTVLLEEEDGGDPIAEEVRSILDGHIVLSRKLGQAGHYPAIDVLASVSRVFDRVTNESQRRAAAHVRALMSKHDELQFLLQVGEYKPGSDPLGDEAIEKLPAINALLRQHADEPSSLDESINQLMDLV
jgi:ATP synthase in type III secretion protein N